MGKRKDKKKGHGAEKTAAKMEKKLAKKEKKVLAAKGEEDIESLIAEFKERDGALTKITVEKCGPPAPRTNMSISVHPERPELIVFGGELFTGNKTFLYNDLFIYNMKKKDWMKVSSPNSPPPRSSHQAVVVPQGGGQIWVFGGEFASPSQSQFYHYKDLWCYHIREQSWEQIPSKGGPTARSGHRMVAFRKSLILFGGFHDNLRDCKYYNDVYMFNLETRRWTKLDPSGVAPPAARSACHLWSQSETGRIYMYGGYSKRVLKKDDEKGVVHTDMFALVMEDRKSTDPAPTKWKWQQVKYSGDRPSSRTGMSSVQISETRIFLFGGVHDDEADDDDDDKSTFYNDQFFFDLEKLKFFTVNLCGPIKEAIQSAGDSAEPMDTSEDLQTEPQQEEIIHDDGVFTVKIGPTPIQGAIGGATAGRMNNTAFVPKPRMKAELAFKQNTLMLLGGSYETPEGKQITLDDFYSLDTSSLVEWRTLHEGTYDKMVWEESESEEESEEEEGESSEEEQHMDS